MRTQTKAITSFLGTYKKIAKDVDVCEATISKIMKKLQENGFIKKLQNGAWFVNPNILMKGNDQKRQILLSYYEAENPMDELTFKRVKRKEFDTETPQEFPQERLEGVE